ncbi:hypothetical protein BHM03_00047721 [Ensete ventricosum]|nr:hypothetical protein BHM03_00047721 [Ensete ventricosum]
MPLLELQARKEKEEQTVLRLQNYENSRLKEVLAESNLGLRLLLESINIQPSEEDELSQEEGEVGPEADDLHRREGGASAALWRNAKVAENRTEEVVPKTVKGQRTAVFGRSRRAVFDRPGDL